MQQVDYLVAGKDEKLAHKRTQSAEGLTTMNLVDESAVVSRKQSASDLQSRLKTRKLLGVGELARDNGDVYKSKISQLLGINESLYVRLPRGLLYWNTLNTVYFHLSGILCIVVPWIGIWVDIGFTPENDQNFVFARLYGVALLSYGLLFRSILIHRETRAEIATLLVVTAILHGLQLLVCISCASFHWLQVAIRLAMIIGNICYHSHVDGQGGLHRQAIRLIEDYALLCNSPVVEKKPLIDVVTSDEHSKNE